MSAFGAVTTLTTGAATLNGTSGYNFFFLQNNDTNKLTATFKDASANVLGQIVLEPAPAAGRGGGYIDSVGFPMFLDAVGGSVVLAGTGSGQFSSGASKLVPTVIFSSNIAQGR